jgi:murein L,D-transpeptidase YcbB/YkuD
MRAVYSLALALILTITATAAPAQDASVGEALRGRLEQLKTAGRIDVGQSTILSRQALPRIYESNNFKPIWTAQGLTVLIGLVKDSAQDGLNPEDYHLADLTQLAPAISASDAATRAQLDLVATDAYTLLLYHLYFGKVDPVSIHPAWNFDKRAGAERDIVPLAKEALLTQNRLAEAVAKARPTQWMYEAMRSALSQYRAIEAKGGWNLIPEGPALKLGSQDSRVAALRQRLNVSGDLTGQPVDSPNFDEPLAAAVRAFQERHKISADGALGAGTLKELNVPVAARVDQIRVNLERGRWVLHEITSADLVVVDVAGFEVSYLRDRKVLWQGNAQVGKAYRQTPVFKSAIDHVVFNPTWTVPPGILGKDMLPAIRRNPDYLAKKKLQVIDRSGKPVDPASIDWAKYTGNNFPYMLRQGPGPDNALGLVKIMFPNSYLVYLHDTPSKSLFDQTERAFSSGCIRVQRPFELAELVLNDPQTWNRDSIDAVIKTGETRTARLKTPVPVLLMYWTVDPTQEGRVVFKRDPYGRDAKTLQALDAPLKLSPLH